MKGLEFQRCNSYIDLFSGFSFEKYDWYLYEDEIIIDDMNYSGPAKISIDTIKSILRNSLIVFMNLQVFPKGADGTFVRDYKDFTASDCSFVVLVTDASYVEIYVKSHDDLVKFYGNALRCGCKSLTTKNSRNDGRATFSVI